MSLTYFKARAISCDRHGFSQWCLSSTPPNWLIERNCPSQIGQQTLLLPRGQGANRVIAHQSLENSMLGGPWSRGAHYTREQRFFGPLSFKVVMRIIHQDALYTRYCFPDRWSGFKADHIVQYHGWYFVFFFSFVSFVLYSSVSWLMVIFCPIFIHFFVTSTFVKQIV